MPKIYYYDKKSCKSAIIENSAIICAYYNKQISFDIEKQRKKDKKFSL